MHNKGGSDVFGTQSENRLIFGIRPKREHIRRETRRIRMPGICSDVRKHTPLKSLCQKPHIPPNRDPDSRAHMMEKNPRDSLARELEDGALRTPRARVDCSFFGEDRNRSVAREPIGFFSERAAAACVDRGGRRPRKTKAQKINGTREIGLAFSKSTCA